jgi:NAD(P)-dependent dehydrogenase (short-subunit alcohol dehydrogenase family)
MDANRFNPVALITGAAAGISAACARDIARRAEGGLILCDVDEQALSDLADQLEAHKAAPERVSTLAFDLADPERWAQAADFIKAQYGRLDWALIEADAATPPAAAETDLVQWPAATNLEGASLALRTVMPLMRGNAQGGAIVVSASTAAIKADPGVGGSGASNTGLLPFVRAAAKDGAPDSVRVNAIARGGVETPMWSSAPWLQDLVRETGSEPAAFDKIASMAMPLARYAKSEDIARLIIMLLSDESPITGATLVVDGGYTL